MMDILIGGVFVILLIAVVIIDIVLLICLVCGYFMLGKMVVGFGKQAVIEVVKAITPPPPEPLTYANTLLRPAYPSDYLLRPLLPNDEQGELSNARSLSDTEQIFRLR